MRHATDCDNARHGHCTSMANAQAPFNNTKVGCGLCSSASKQHLRRSSRSAMDDDIRECHAGAEPSPQCLQDSFFSGEPTCQTLDSVGSIAYLVQLLLNEAALDQRIAWVLDPALHLGDVDEIEGIPYYIHFLCESPPTRLRAVVH